MGVELLQSGLAGVIEAAALPLLQHVLMREPEAILLLASHLLLFSQFPLLFPVEAKLPISPATSLLR